MEAPERPRIQPNTFAEFRSLNPDLVNVEEVEKHFRAPLSICIAILARLELAISDVGIESEFYRELAEDLASLREQLKQMLEVEEYLVNQIRRRNEKL